MNDKAFKIMGLIGTIGWVFIFIGAVSSLIYRVITGDGDTMTPLIVLILIAVNFNISSILRYKRYEAEQAAMILEKMEYPQQQVSRFVQNPYLN